MTRLALITATIMAGAAMASTATAQDPPGGGGGASETRIAAQGRLDTFNLFVDGATLALGGMGGGFFLEGVFVPQITAGVRLSRIFVGVGFGFSSFSNTECDNQGCAAGKTTTSSSSWSFSPLFSFDLLSDDFGAVYVLGWLNLGTLGATERTQVQGGMTNTTSTDGAFWWGLSAGAGVRGNVTPGVALGGELGWGFGTSTDDGSVGGDGDDETNFLHGIFGIITVEASVGI